MLNRLKKYYTPFVRRLTPLVSTGMTLESLEDRKLLSASYPIGINLNDTSAGAVSKVVPIMKSMGIKTVRLWYSVSSFSNHTFGGTLQRAIDYSNAGFDVTLEVDNAHGTVPSPAAVKGWFDWATSNTALKNAVDRWEIGNEVDQKHYWQGSLSQYVTEFLKPASEALHSAGEEVVSAGPSWNPQDVQTLINDGMLNYVDYVGFHPYANGASAVVASVKAVNSIVAGRKPIALTEWNVRGYEGNKTAWAQAVQDAYPQVAANSALNYYFALKTQNTPAGPGGILTKSYTPNQPFYNAFATFSSAGSGNSGGGNTPSGIAASISGSVWNDKNGDGKWDASESPIANATVFIDTNGNGQLDKGESSTVTDTKGAYKFSNLKAATYKISDVFATGFQISNSSRPYITGTVKTGQKLLGVNIGSKAIVSTPVPVPVPTPTPGPVVGTPTVTGFQILNASTGKVLGTYSNVTGNVSIQLSSLATKNIAVIALANSSTESLKLKALGKTVTENNAPYSFFGDVNGKYKAWAATKGSYTFSATAYAKDNLAGAAGNTKSVTITFH